MSTCNHSPYWRGNYGTCMACRAENAETELQSKDREIAELREELRILRFQSSLNDSDMPDAELVAAIHDAVLHITTDEDNGICGTVLEKVEAMAEQWPKDMEEIADLKRQLEATKADNEHLLIERRKLQNDVEFCASQLRKYAPTEEQKKAADDLKRQLAVARGLCVDAESVLRKSRIDPEKALSVWRKLSAALAATEPKK